MVRSCCRFLGLLSFAVAGWAAAAEPGFTPLFEGKNDLTGWRYVKDILSQGETADKRFYVAGGSIVMAAKDKDGKKDVRDLFAVREFTRDFTLRLEFKASQEAIGSVTIRNTAIPVGDFIRRGEQKQLKNFRNDDWNVLEVVVKMAAHAEGRRLTESDTLEAGFQNGKATAKLNGRVIDPNRVVIQIEGYPKVNDEPLTSFPVALATKGNVGLRTGSGKIEFRNIRFKEMP
jgi:hypothetical protein